MKMFNGIKKVINDNKKETQVLVGAFLFAVVGDFVYGGVAGAESYLVGTLLSGVSNLLYTVFLIMVLFKLLFRVITSEKFHGVIRSIPEPGSAPSLEPQAKSRVKKK